MSDTNKVFIMLVGLPGTGKSTYCQKNKHLIDNCTIVSSDDIMMDIAYKYGFTYNQLFDDVTYSFCEKMMYRIANSPVLAKHYAGTRPGSRTEEEYYLGSD